MSEDRDRALQAGRPSNAKTWVACAKSKGRWGGRATHHSAYAEATSRALTFVPWALERHRRVIQGLAVGPGMRDLTRSVFRGEV